MIERIEIISVPERMTKLVEMPILRRGDEAVDAIKLSAIYKATVIRLIIANGQLAAIASLETN